MSKTDSVQKFTRKNKFLRVIKIIFFTLLLSSFALASFIAYEGLTDELNPADVAVVMGTTANKDGTPSRWLKTRLDRAVEVYEAGLISSIIVSGGTGTNGVNEGDVMRDYLVEKGVSGAIIIVDNLGVDTYSTARNVKEIMEVRGWTSAMVVSQFYHIARVKLALARLGIAHIYGAHARWITGMAVVWVLREVVAYPVYFLRSY